MTKKSRQASKAKPALTETSTTKNIEKIMSIQREAEAKRTFGQHLADVFARSVGSWTFIVIQSALLTAWVIANVVHIVKPWDPYPFILLNLALSFQAAYASPIIMMSQNRQARLADERNHLALQIELLAEQESTETLILLQKVCDHLGIKREHKQAVDLEQSTDPKALHAEIRKAEMKEKSAPKTESS